MNIFGVGALVVTIVLILFFMQQSNAPVTEKTVSINSVSVRVAVADTPTERTLGLSGREALAEGEGMLFIFEEEGNWGIWMKDMHFAIDVIWARSDGLVISVAPHLTPETYPQAFYPDEPQAKYVLEVPAGFATSHNIAKGSKLVVQ